MMSYAWLCIVMWHDGSSMVSDDELCGIMYDYVPSCTLSYVCRCMELNGYAIFCWVMYKYLTWWFDYRPWCWVMYEDVWKCMVMLYYVWLCAIMLCDGRTIGLDVKLCRKLLGIAWLCCMIHYYVYQCECMVHGGSYCLSCYALLLHKLPIMFRCKKIFCQFLLQDTSYMKVMC